jgi:hypothetical protein
VLPGYFETLNAGNANNNIPENISILKILRYLLWAYSFKFGIYFFVLGVLLNNKMGKKSIAIYSVIGFLYIGFAYVPIPIKSSLFFGIGGGIATISALILFYIMGFENIKPQKNIFEYFALFFIINGIYNLCPLMGVKCFALYPEKMIQYNTQDDAFSFANHITIEFALGFILLVYSRIRQIKYENK